MSARATAVVLSLAAAGCGKLGFDGVLSASLVTGSSTADLEVCGGQVQWSITDEAGAVLHSGRTEGAHCTKLEGLLIDRGASRIHARAASVTGGETVEIEEEMKPAWTLETTPAGVRVWVHRPEAMYRDPDAPVPVLVFFHGLGHSAGNNDALYSLASMPHDSGFLELFGGDAPGANPLRVDALVGLPFAMLAPNCLYTGSVPGITFSCGNWGGAPAVFDETMRHAGMSFGIDASRVYVTGLSTGGEGTVRTAIERADQIAAAIPVGSTRSDDPWQRANVCRASTVPLWLFHSDNDSGPTTPDNTRSYASTMNACVPPPTEAAQYDLGDWRFMGSGHGGWYEVYGDAHGMRNRGEASIYAWLLRHTR